MSSQEFKDYVANSGVVFDELSDDEKGLWRETFDRSRMFPQIAPEGIQRQILFLMNTNNTLLDRYS
jgi:hypothetical protein